VQHGLDLDHAILGIAAANVAALHVPHRVRVLTMTLHERVLARQLLELRRRHEPRVVQQQDLMIGQ
jgi:hypothetical protein